MKTKLLIACLLVAVAQPVFAKEKTHRPRAVQEPHIACTVLGCIPVPPECGQTYGRTRRGSPTGYDVIICPPGVWPLK
jgi:hypothetical protein